MFYTVSSAEFGQGGGLLEFCEYLHPYPGLIPICHMGLLGYLLAHIPCPSSPVKELSGLV